MGSHQDSDSLIVPKALRELFEKESKSIPERMASLNQRMQHATERGANLITAGHVGESVLFEERHKGILIRRLENDPDRVLRVSLGAPEWAGDQAYLVFRGDPQKIHDLLRRAEKAMRRALRREEKL